MLTALRRLSRQLAANISPGMFIAGIGSALLLSLIVLRVIMLRAELAQSPLPEALQVLAIGSRQDFALAMLLTSGFLGVNWLLGGRAGQKPLVISFLAINTIILLWSTANLEVVRLLGEPLTVDWLYYSDFLGSLEAVNGILFSATLGALFLAALIPAAFMICSVLVAIALKCLTDSVSRPLIAFVCVLIPVLLYSDHQANTVVPRGKFLNPVVAFAESLLFQNKLNFGPTENVLNDADRLHHTSKLKSSISQSRQFASGVKNVILFVLESTPAEYIQNYGGVHPVTPNMLKYGSSAVRFENIYAHAPATNYSLVSLITSIYPELSSRSMTEQYPDLRLETIASVLSNKGYRTAFFNSSDIRFQGAERFLRNKGFDTIEDYRNWQCETGVYRASSEKWKYLDFSSDLCTVKSLTNWIDKSPTKPFLAAVWTGMTHYPYFTEGEVKQYAPDDNLNRYLNALRTGDEAFGNLMRFLEDRNLANSTLVVVLGDHGEAFGRHGNFIHASDLYEENVHIPLIFINRQLFSGETSAAVGGIYDIAPTVLNILGMAAPYFWQGQSLFSPQRPDSVYFFSPWNGFLVGYRQGSRKAIYNSDSQEMQIFDLSSDPQESRNLAVEEGESSTEAKQKIVAWVQYQNHYIDSILNNSPLLAGASSSKMENSPKLTVYASGTSYKSSPRGEVLVDGASVGFFAVNSAPSNSQQPAEATDINDALTAFEFPLDMSSCPRRVEVRFLNDEWAGESKSGDTNLLIQGINVNGTNYSAELFKLDTPDAGNLNLGYMSLWREGSVHIDLDSIRVCG